MDKKTFHIVGICGIGMSAIAQILKNLGHNVKGLILIVVKLKAL